ncbi:MAG: FMN-binding protein [Bacteroidetes bacterium]|nr:FMN-binding protein [Bacteroidota bacterium]
MNLLFSIILFPVLFLCCGNTASAQIRISQNYQKLLQESVEILSGKPASLTLISSEKLGFNTTAPFDLVEIKSGNDNYFALVDEVKGKTQQITYSVLFHPDGSIADLDVLVYRESYGGEIDYKVFRNQFAGKSAQEKPVWGKSIRNISGATISCRSVTTGAQKLTDLFESFRKKIHS